MMWTGKQILGEWGELWVQNTLALKTSEVCRRLHDYRGPDLSLGDQSIEVKTATRRRQKSGYVIWRGNIPGGLRADWLVLVCRMAKSPVAFIIPRSEFGDRNYIAISGNPLTYTGRWAKYRENWRPLIESVSGYRLSSSLKSHRIRE